jgi:hypothetical protein
MKKVFIDFFIALFLFTVLFIYIVATYGWIKAIVILVISLIILYFINTKKL